MMGMCYLLQAAAFLFRVACFASLVSCVLGLAGKFFSFCTVKGIYACFLFERRVLSVVLRASCGVHESVVLKNSYFALSSLIDHNIRGDESACEGAFHFGACSQGFLAGEVMCSSELPAPGGGSESQTQKQSGGAASLTVLMVTC